MQSTAIDAESPVQRKNPRTRFTEKILKSIAVMREAEFVLLLLRGDHVLNEIKLRVQGVPGRENPKQPFQKSRVLVTTLTKKSSEDLTSYLLSRGIKVKYLHSDIDTLERIEILRDLRLGVFDVLIGINLLREGLDLPEVSLVAILDADKEGFLRSTRSLISWSGSTRIA